jgi:hypothetical protein
VRLLNGKRRMRSGWRGSAAARKPRRLRRNSQLNRDDDALVAVRDECRLRFIRLLPADTPAQPLELADLIHWLEQRGSVVAVLVEPAD